MWKARLFDGFMVERDGIDVTVRLPAKARELLALLSLNIGVPRRKEVLAELLWPDSDSRRQSQSLRQVVAAINQFLESDGSLHSLRGWLKLSKEGWRTDLMDFDELVQSLPLESLFEVEQNLKSLTALYVGRVLGDLPYTWADAERSRIEDDYIRSVVALAKQYAQSCGSTVPEKALVCALNRVGEREALLTALVEICSDQGKSEDALIYFERLERYMDDEWGEFPSEAALNAIRRLGAQSSHGRRPRSDSSANDGDPVLIGREEEESALLALLDARICNQCVTIVGAGGVGKTVFARALAAKLSRPICFVELRDVAEGESLLALVSNQLWNKFDLDQPDSLAALKAFSEKGGVVILDGVEGSLLSVQELIENLHSQKIDSLILVTSRCPIGTQNERLFWIRPFDCFESVARDLGMSPALRLFSLESGIPINASTRPHVLSLVRRLGGNPLAIRQLAHRARSLSLERLSSMEDSSILDLPISEPTGQTRSLRESIAGDLFLLDSVERQDLVALSMLPEWFTEADSAKIFGRRSSISRIQGFVDRGFLLRSSIDGIDQVTVVPLVRPCLHDLPEYESIARSCAAKIFDHFEQIANNLRWRFDGSEPGAAFRELAKQYPLLLKCIEHRDFLEHGHTRLGKILHLLSIGLNALGKQSEIEATYEEVLQSPDIQADRCLNGTLKSSFATLLLTKASLERAKTQVDEALELLETCQERTALASAINTRIHLFLVSPPGKLDKAEAERLFALAVRGRDLLHGEVSKSWCWDPQSVRSTLLSNSACILRVLGRSEEAISALQEAIALAAGLGNMRTCAAMTLSLADVYMDMGCFDDSFSLAAQAVALSQQAEQPYLIEQAARTFAISEFLLGNRRSAISRLSGQVRTEKSRLFGPGKSTSLFWLSAFLAEAGSCKLARRTMIFAKRAGWRVDLLYVPGQADIQKLASAAPTDVVAAPDPLVKTSELRALLDEIDLTVGDPTTI